MTVDTNIVIIDPAQIPVEIVKEYFQLHINHNDIVWNHGVRSRFVNLAKVLVSYTIAAKDITWVGEASTAAEKTSPLTVTRLRKIYENRGGVVKITPRFISTVTVAFNLPHISYYETPYFERGKWRKFRGVSNARSVKKFLNQHIGKYSYMFDD